MIKLTGHTLTPGERITPESNALTLTERGSIARITLGPEQPELNVDDWVLENEEPGAGIVWRVKTVETTFNTRTRVITLEHAINTLRDVSMFGEVTADMISGGVDCTARQAADYVLGHQNIWTLETFDYSMSAPFRFNGEDLFSALQTITSALDDPWWDYDMSALPFKLHIRRKTTGADCEMRMGRNLSTLRKMVDRTQMYTRIYPIGENDIHIAEEYLSKNEEIYGRKDKVLTDTSKSDPEMLRLWALDKLNRHCEPTVTITIGGLELSRSTGESLDHLVLGRNCRVPLPEFGTAITERITKLNWRDAVKEKENVTVTLCNTLQDIASIINKEISEGAGYSGSASRAAAKKQKEDHAWFIDTESHVGMVAEAIIGGGPDGVNWSRVAEIIVDGEGIHDQVVLAMGSLIVAFGRQDMTEYSLTTVFQKTGIGSLDAGQTLYGMQVMSAESLYTVFQKTGIGSLGQNETLYGMQRMNAESLVTVFQKTGIGSLGNNETLYGMQRMSAESLLTVFKKTGIDSLGNNETLYGRQIMTVESLSTVYRKTGIDNLGNNETLYSRQTQTAESLTTVYQKTGINSLGQNETLYSKVTQTAESLTSKVGKGEIASTINQTAQSVLIKASKINLEGYVTATELDAEKARFDNLVSGKTAASTLYATNFYSTNFYVNNRMGTWQLPSMGDASVDGSVLSASQLKLDHCHNVTITENNGTVTVEVGKARTTAGSDFFNIADTTFYQNGVSAAWTAAANEVDMLGRKNGTGNYVSLKNQTGTITLDYGETYQVKTVWKSGANNPQSSIVRTIAAPSSVPISISGAWNATGLQYVGYENTYHIYNNGSEVGSKTIYLSSYGNDTIVAREDSYSGAVIAKIDSKYSAGYSAGESAGYNNGYSAGYTDGQQPGNNYFSFAWNGTGISTRFRIHMNDENTGLVGHLAYDGDYITMVGNDGNTYARLLRSP